jgi:chromosome segregation ATPase
MIVQTASELRHQLQEYSRLKKNASQLASIENAARDLADIQRQIKAWIGIYPALHPYFLDLQRDELTKQVTEIYRRLDECKTRFENDNRYPQELLKRLHSLGVKLTYVTQQAWHQYAQTCLTPIQETVNSARQLPKMQSKLGQVDDILNGLVGQSQKLPKRPSDVQHFHAQINAIKSKLQEVETMNVQQKAFLDKVHQGAATLADLDDSLLQWCIDQGLASQLKIISKV